MFSNNGEHAGQFFYAYARLSQPGLFQIHTQSQRIGTAMAHMLTKMPPETKREEGTASFASRVKSSFRDESKIKTGRKR